MKTHLTQDEVNRRGIEAGITVVLCGFLIADFAFFVVRIVAGNLTSIAGIASFLLACILSFFIGILATETE